MNLEVFYRILKYLRFYPNIYLVLVSNLISLWYEDIFGMIQMCLNPLAFILWPRICSLPRTPWMSRFSSQAGVTGTVPGSMLTPGWAASNPFSWFCSQFWVVSLCAFMHRYSGGTLHRSPSCWLCELLSFPAVCPCPQISSHRGLPGLAAIFPQSRAARFCLSSPSLCCSLETLKLVAWAVVGFPTYWRSLFFLKWFTMFCRLFFPIFCLFWFRNVDKSGPCCCILMGILHQSLSPLRSCSSSHVRAFPCTGGAPAVSCNSLLCHRPARPGTPASHPQPRQARGWQFVFVNFHSWIGTDENVYFLLTWREGRSRLQLCWAQLAWLVLAGLAWAQLHASRPRSPGGGGTPVSWWRSRIRGTRPKHTNTLKAPAQPWLTSHLCTFHRPKQSNSQAQNQMCGKVHPTYKDNDKDWKINDDYDQTIIIFHGFEDLLSLAVFSLLCALLGQWTFSP